MNLIDRIKAAWLAFHAKKEPLNGGHRYGIQIGSDCYYWADEIGTDKGGQLAWECRYPDHLRRGHRGPEGEVILEYLVMNT